MLYLVVATFWIVSCKGCASWMLLICNMKDNCLCVRVQERSCINKRFNYVNMFVLCMRCQLTCIDLHRAWKIESEMHPSMPAQRLSKQRRGRTESTWVAPIEGCRWRASWWRRRGSSPPCCGTVCMFRSMCVCACTWFLCVYVSVCAHQWVQHFKSNISSVLKLLKNQLISINISLLKLNFSYKFD